MEELVINVDYWHWWIVGGVFLLLEVFVSGFFFIWMAVAAAIVGAALMLFPDMSWKIQLIIFSILSVASIAFFRRYQKVHPVTTDQPELNRRSRQYIGRTFTLQNPIVNGVGNLHVDDTTWRIVGEDMPSGQNITVVDVDGVLLKVEKTAGK
jgi:membrane protein implicated in regulation of membrane protease activity